MLLAPELAPGVHIGSTVCLNSEVIECASSYCYSEARWDNLKTRLSPPSITDEVRLQVSRACTDTRDKHKSLIMQCEVAAVLSFSYSWYGIYMADAVIFSAVCICRWLHILTSLPTSFHGEPFSVLSRQSI